MRRKSLIGVIILAILTVTSIYIHTTIPYCPSKWSPLQEPSPAHPLGTDPIGRDVTCLAIAGYTASVTAGLSALASSLAILTATVYISTHKQGRNIVNETVSILTGLPKISLLLLLALITKLSPLLIGAIIGTLASIQGIRGVAVSTRQITTNTYIEASKAVGASNTHIATKHILPNTINAIASYTSIASATAIYAEAGLAMIGLTDPSTPSWGKIIGLILQTPGAILTTPGLIQITSPLILIITTATIFYLSTTTLKQETNT